MKFLNKLERRFGQFAITNLTYYLIGGQVIVFLLSVLYPQSIELLLLSGNRVLEGEFWRILGFLFYPISTDYFWTIFVWYIYFLYGSALERQWGAFRYNLFVGISFAATVIASLILSDLVFTNIYLYTSIFLAFAYLFPDFRLYLFFILPIKVKWLSYLAWIGLIAAFLSGPLSAKIMISIAVINFLLFFGKEIATELTLKSRGKAGKAGSIHEKEKPDHVCQVCKRNEISDPKMEIRYCSECNPVTCYCEKHIDKHKHIKKK
jgi:hypothetical protein